MNHTIMDIKDSILITKTNKNNIKKGRLTIGWAYSDGGSHRKGTTLKKEGLLLAGHIQTEAPQDHV